MNTQHIQTGGDFARFLDGDVQLLAQQYDGSLETYLTALWTIVESQRTTPPSFQRFAEFVARAFEAQPQAFDPQWLTYTAPPELSADDTETAADDFLNLQHTLLYQIADLHLMKQAGTLNDPHRFMGVESPTGHTWYNFDPGGFLSCASAGLDPEATGTACKWADLALVLWLGQNYE